MLTVAMKPLEAASNRYPGLLSESLRLDERLNLVPFDWAKLGRGAYDVVVFQWPDEFFMPESRKRSLRLLQRAVMDRARRGTRFVWIAHNLAPHDGAGRASTLTRTLFLRLLSGVICLSDASRDQLHDLYPETRRVRSTVIPHGAYPALQPARAYDGARTSGRMLFFGALRAYKNPVGLVNAARAVGQHPFSLTLAGHVWRDGSLKQDIMQAAGDDPRITLDLRSEPIPEPELERLIDAHDCVVLPYTNILNSGVALHALSRNKPILAPAIGSLPELQRDVGREWVQLFEGRFGAADIERFLAALPDVTAAAPDLSAFAWDRIGRDAAAFLKSL